MIEETIDARYTLVQSVLEEQLEAWFGKDNFKIIEPPDDYAKWKVSIPRKLQLHEKAELRRRFVEFRRRQKKRAVAEGAGEAGVGAPQS